MIPSPEEVFADIVSEAVEAAVDQVAYEIAQRDSKWEMRLLTVTGDGEPLFFPAWYASAYSKYNFSTSAIGEIAFDDEEA